MHPKTQNGLKMYLQWKNRFVRTRKKKMTHRPHRKRFWKHVFTNTYWQRVRHCSTHRTMKASQIRITHESWLNNAGYVKVEDISPLTRTLRLNYIAELSPSTRQDPLSLPASWKMKRWHRYGGLEKRSCGMCYRPKNEYTAKMRIQLREKNRQNRYRR